MLLLVNYSEKMLYGVRSFDAVVVSASVLYREGKQAEEIQNQNERAKQLTVLSTFNNIILKGFLIKEAVALLRKQHYYGVR